MDTPTYPATLGERMKQLRKDRGMTLKELGKEAGLSVSFLCDIERDRTCPSVASLMDLVRILETTAAYLTGESNRSEPVATAAMDTIIQLTRLPEGLEALKLLESFPTWPEQRRKEALSYLAYLNAGNDKL